MNSQDVFEFYEKLYFHEVEAREKIAARLQIPLAIILSIFSVYAYFIKGIDSGSLISFWGISFILVFICCTFVFTICIYHFVKSFFGHTYEFIPSAKDSDDYRKALIETYKEYEGQDELVNQNFREYVYDYYRDCSSENTRINDRRSDHLHKCTSFQIMTGCLLVVSFLLFTFGGIKKAPNSDEYKVSIVKPVSIETSKSPVKVDGEISTTVLKVDFSKEVKGYLNDRKKGQDATATTATTAEKASD